MQYCVVKYKDNNFLLVAQSRREFLEKSLQTSLPVLDVFLGITKQRKTSLRKFNHKSTILILQSMERTLSQQKRMMSLDIFLIFRFRFSWNEVSTSIS
jgi:CDP-diacylglycerol pyrophosphatase